MPEVELVDGNEILHSHSILFDIQHAGTSKIDNAVSLERAHHFADPVKLRAGPVIDQVSKLDIVIRSAVIGVDNR